MSVRPPRGALPRGEEPPPSTHERERRISSKLDVAPPPRASELAASASTTEIPLPPPEHSASPELPPAAAVRASSGSHPEERGGSWHAASPGEPPPPGRHPPSQATARVAHWASPAAEVLEEVAAIMEDLVLGLSPATAASASSASTSAVWGPLGGPFNEGASFPGAAWGAGGATIAASRHPRQHRGGGPGSDGPPHGGPPRRTSGGGVAISGEALTARSFEYFRGHPGSCPPARRSGDVAATASPYRHGSLHPATSSTAPVATAAAPPYDYGYQQCGRLYPPRRPAAPSSPYLQNYPHPHDSYHVGGRQEMPRLGGPLHPGAPPLVDSTPHLGGHVDAQQPPPLGGATEGELYPYGWQRGSALQGWRSPEQPHWERCSSGLPSWGPAPAGSEDMPPPPLRGPTLASPCRGALDESIPSISQNSSRTQPRWAPQGYEYSYPSRPPPPSRSSRHGYGDHPRAYGGFSQGSSSYDYCHS